MFGSLVREAKATVESSVTDAINRALMTLPFLIAGAFLTAALSAYLVRLYGVELGLSLMAILFIVLGLAGLAILPVQRPDAASADAAANAGANESSTQSTDTADAASKPAWSQSEKDLLFAAITSAAPIAVPAIFRGLVRHLPILLAIIAAIFVMTRPSQSQSTSASASANLDTDTLQAAASPAE